MYYVAIILTHTSASGDINQTTGENTPITKKLGLLKLYSRVKKTIMTPVI